MRNRQTLDEDQIIRCRHKGYYSSHVNIKRIILMDTIWYDHCKKIFFFEKFLHQFSNCYKGHENSQRLENLLDKHLYFESIPSIQISALQIKLRWRIVHEKLEDCAWIRHWGCSQQGRWWRKFSAYYNFSSFWSSMNRDAPPCPPSHLPANTRGELPFSHQELREVTELQNWHMI